MTKAEKRRATVKSVEGLAAENERLAAMVQEHKKQARQLIELLVASLKVAESMRGGRKHWDELREYAEEVFGTKFEAGKR